MASYLLVLHSTTPSRRCGFGPIKMWRARLLGRANKTFLRINEGFAKEKSSSLKADRLAVVWPIKPIQYIHLAHLSPKTTGGCRRIHARPKSPYLCVYLSLWYHIIIIFKAFITLLLVQLLVWPIKKGVNWQTCPQIIEKQSTAVHEPATNWWRHHHGWKRRKESGDQEEALAKREIFKRNIK